MLNRALDTRRSVASIFVASLGMLSTVSLAEATPRTPTHVACVGDSITQGTGASSASTNYPANLQKLLGNAVKVANFGHSGATMLSAGFGDAPYQNDTEYQAATSFVTSAGAGAVVDVVILLGANDSSSRNWTPAGKPKNDQQFLKDYRAMVQHFMGLSPTPVVYLALPLATGNNCSCGTFCCQISGKVIHDEQIPLIRQVAEEQKLPTIDLNTPTAGHPEYFGDGIHPNNAGYVVVAQIVKDGLLRVPTVTVTAPKAGASLSTAMPITLSADASGGTVAVDSVEFFQGLTSLGKSMTSPFSASWPAAVGSYSLSAKAIDSTGASATSDPVNVEVAAASGGADGADGGGSAGAAGSGGAAGAASSGGAAGAAGSASVAGAAGSGGATSAAAGRAGSGGAAADASVGGSAATDPSVNSSDCSCRVAGYEPATRWSGTVTLLLAILTWLIRTSARRDRLEASRWR
jgi:acyl-CoA thioesterase I